MTFRTSHNGEVTSGTWWRSIPVCLVVASLVLSALFLQGVAEIGSAATESGAAAATPSTAISAPPPTGVSAGTAVPSAITTAAPASTGTKVIVPPTATASTSPSTVPTATAQVVTTTTPTAPADTATLTTAVPTVPSSAVTQTPTATATHLTSTAAPSVAVAAQKTPRPVYAQGLRTVKAANGREVAAGRIIVGYKDGVTEAERQAAHQKARGLGIASATAIKSLGQSTEVVDVSSATSIDEAIRTYASDPRVKFAQPDYVVKASEVPNDTLWSSYQWDMRKINAPVAWDYTHGSSSVLVAILDSGIYTDHPDLAGKVVASNDLRNLSDPIDRFGHGTHIAGITAAIPNNGQGIAGIGWNTRLLNGKVLYDTGSGYESDVIAGINWATAWGANVLNLSLGYATAFCDIAMQDSINNAYAHNAVIVAAAGNDGLDEVVIPARCNHVLSVASTDSNDAKASTSNYGTWVTVAAPGANIASTWSPLAPEGTGYYYGTLSGTSMAAPHVSGLAALVWATQYGTSAQAVIDRIKSTADQIAGTGTLWQAGRINAAAAVNSRAPLAATYSSTPPTSWSAGETKTYSLILTNTGSQTWLASGINRVDLSVSFGTSDDTPGVGWAARQAVLLPSDVAPGGSVTLSLNVTAPSTAGNYVLRHRLIKEGVGWFDQLQKTNVSVQ